LIQEKGLERGGGRLVIYCWGNKRTWELRDGRVTIIGLGPSLGGDWGGVNGVLPWYLSAALSTETRGKSCHGAKAALRARPDESEIWS